MKTADEIDQAEMVFVSAGGVDEPREETTGVELETSDEENGLVIVENDGEGETSTESPGSRRRKAREFIKSVSAVIGTLSILFMNFF